MLNKLLSYKVAIVFSIVSYPFGQQPDLNVNAAVLPEATLTGSVSRGKGIPEVVLFDPATNDFHSKRNCSDSDVAYSANLGLVEVGSGFVCRVDRTMSKKIDYPPAVEIGCNGLEFGTLQVALGENRGVDFFFRQEDNYKLILKKYNF